MIDKKIAGIASFAGLAFNNVKASNDKSVHIRLGNDVYCKDNDELTDIKAVKNISNLFDLIKGFKEIKKNGNSDTIKKNFTKVDEDYFITKVLYSGDTTNKLTNGSVIDISGATANVEVTLAPKRKYINFKYTGGKQLTTANEDKILKLIVQGETLAKVKDNDLLGSDYTTHKLGGVKLGDSEVNNVVGSSNINLFGANICELEIDSEKIGDKKFKTFNLDLDPGAKDNLVEGLKLDAFDSLVPVNIIKDNKGTNALIELNKVNDFTDDTSNNGFFKGKFEILKEGKDEDKIDTEKSDSVENFNNAAFYTLKGIKKDNINAKYLKKTFTVQLDDATNTKTIIKADELNEVLNEAFKDSVKITVKDIWDVLKNKNTIIDNTYNGDIKINRKDDELTKNNGLSDDVVDDKTTEFVIKLPEKALVATAIETKFQITCEIPDDKEVNGKKVKQEVIDAIKAIITGTITKITKAGFVKKFNDSITGKTSNFGQEDFVFTNIATGDDINRGGKLSINESFWNKLNDDSLDTTSETGTPNEDNNGTPITNNNNTNNNNTKNTTGGCCKGKCSNKE